MEAPVLGCRHSLLRPLLHAHHPVRAAGRRPESSRADPPRRWCVGFTFDQLESVCACARPLDNCYPVHLTVVDMVVDVFFW